MPSPSLRRAAWAGALALALAGCTAQRDRAGWWRSGTADAGAVQLAVAEFVVRNQCPAVADCLVVFADAATSPDVVTALQAELPGLQARVGNPAADARSREHILVVVEPIEWLAPDAASVQVQLAAVRCLFQLRRDGEAWRVDAPRQVDCGIATP